MKRPKRKQKSGNRGTGTALKRMEAVKSPSEPPTAPTFYLIEQGEKRPIQTFLGLKLAFLSENRLSEKGESAILS